MLFTDALRQYLRGARRAVASLRVFHLVPPLAVLLTLWLAVPGLAQRTDTYLTMSPMDVTVDAGETVRFDVWIDIGTGPTSPGAFGLGTLGSSKARPTKALERIRFSADTGDIEVLFQPTVTSSTAAAEFTARLPGVYVFRAASTYFPEHYVESRVVVRPATAQSLILRSDPGVILPGVGTTSDIEVWMLGADGTVSTTPSLNWRSSDPQFVTVDADGTLTAVAGFGSAVITVSHGDLLPLKVSVSVASLQPETRLVPRHDILYIDGDRVLLSATAGSATFIGDILISGKERGLMARVAALDRVSNGYLATVESVGFPDAFRAIRIRSKTPWIEDTEIEPGASSSSAHSGSAPLKTDDPPTPDPAGPCEITDAPGDITSVSLAYTAPYILSTRRVQIEAEYELLEGRTPTFAMWLEGTRGVEIETSELALTTSFGVSIECVLKSSRSIPFPVVPLGPIVLSFDLTPKVGASFSFSLDGSVTLGVPGLSRQITTQRGLGYDGTSFYPISTQADTGMVIEWPEGDPVDTDASINVGAELFLAADLSFGISQVDIFKLDMLELRLSGLASASMSMPFSVPDTDYSGPEWSLGVGVSASLAPLFEDIKLLWFLGYLGIDIEGSFDVVLMSEELTLAGSPEIDFGAVVDDPGNPQQVSYFVSAPGAEGASVELLAWPESNPSASPSLEGSLVLDDNGEGVLTTAWRADKRIVKPRLYHGPFSDYANRPYALADGIPVGGDNPVPPPPTPPEPPPCDGPDCSPSQGGGPQRPGGLPGGGMGSNDAPGGSIGGSGPYGDGSIGGGALNLPQTSGSTGDPHIISFDGLRYNFQAQGEFILAATTVGGILDLENGDLQIQVRQEQVTPGFFGAVNKAVAVRIGDTEVEIYANPDAGESHVYVDDLPHDGSLALGSGGYLMANGSSYFILWPDGSRLGVRRGYQHLDLSLYLDGSRLNQVVGLMGVFDGVRENDFTPRDGTAIADLPINATELYDEHGQSWAVTDPAEAMLDPSRGGGAPVLILPDSFPGPVDPGLLLEAWIRCQAGGVYVAGVLEACRYDVVLLLETATPDYDLIASIIEGHRLSQLDIFGVGEPEILIAGPGLMAAGETVSLVASVNGTASTAAFIWSATSGVINPSSASSADFTAGAEEGPVTITATVTTPDGTVSRDFEILVTSGPQDLRTWESLPHANSGVAWGVDSANGATVNLYEGAGGPSFLMAPGVHQDVVLKGTVHWNGDDADYLGFVFGFAEPTTCAALGAPCATDFFLIDWKSRTPIGGAMSAPYQNLSRFLGDVQLDDSDLFRHLDDTHPSHRLIQGSSDSWDGWWADQTYAFEISIKADQVHVKITCQSGTRPSWDYVITAADAFPGVPDAEFPAGRIGFYNFNQDYAVISNVRIEPASP